MRVEHPCNGCGVLTRNPKYCSYGCAARVNNKLPRKRQCPIGQCADCKTPIQIRLKRCKECRIKFHLQSKENRRQKSTEAVSRWRRNLKKRAIEYKGGKCIRCGYVRCIRALQFHHLNPAEKDFQISRGTTVSWEKVQVELDKCILVCANCHSEIHDELNSVGV